MQLRANELDAMIRQDFAAFIELSFRELLAAEFYSNWHIEKIAQALESCRTGRTRRLIINVPPRSLKSHCATVAFPAWLLGHDPNAQIICASYSQDLAEKHARDCRTLILKEKYQQIFPTRLSPDKTAASEFTTTEGGFRLSTSVGGQLTGRGAEFIIIDDPLKPDEALSDTQRKNVNDWYDSTVVSRLNDKRTGCIIIIMQRLHEDDLVGHVQESDDWTILRFPAIAEQDEVHTIISPYGTEEIRRAAGEALHPEREPLEVLQRIRQQLGEYHFAGQYQQAPAPFGGGMIKIDWFKRYAEIAKPEQFDLIIQSWDTANKATELSDFSVCTTWGLNEKQVYLLHVLRKRLNYPELKRTVIEQARMFDAKHILIEDKASGTQLIQELLHDGVYEVNRYEPKVEKVLRMETASSLIENGFVHLPEKAPWLSDLIEELQAFPKSKYDDQVDSISQALDWIKGRELSACYGLIEFWKQEAERMKQDPDCGAPTRYNYLNSRDPEFLFPAHLLRRW
jgi:predicted phage terminase large subunit-like protein